MGRLHALLAACVVAVVFAPDAAPAGSSPTSVLASIIVAAEQQQSFRATSTQTGCACKADVRVSQVTDVGATEGSQRVTYTRDGRTGHVTVIVAGGDAYVRGDAFALSRYMGFAPAAVSHYANRWIEIPPTDRDFASVAADVTRPTALRDLIVPSPLKLSPARAAGGRAVVGVTTTRRATAKSAAATMSLYGRATGTRLPVEEDVASGRYAARITFARWNEPLHVAAPVGATPISATGLE